MHHIISHISRALLGVVVLAGALKIAPAMAADAGQIILQRPEPVMLIDGGYPVACGFAANGELQGKAVRIEVLNRKEADGLKFVIAAEASPAFGDIVVSAGDVVDVQGFSGAAEVRPGRIERSRAFSPDDGAVFIHALMVSGGAFRLVSPAGQSADLKLQGPLPHNVRSGYLNCAGDLVRPEE